MRFFTNSRGKLFQTGLHGTYPVNDGDPQNDIEFEEEEPSSEEEESDDN